MIWTGKAWVSSVRDRAVVPLMRAVVPSVRETWTPRAWSKARAWDWAEVPAELDNTEPDQAASPSVMSSPEVGPCGMPSRVVPSSDVPSMEGPPRPDLSRNPFGATDPVRPNTTRRSLPWRIRRSELRVRKERPRPSRKIDSSRDVLPEPLPPQIRLWPGCRCSSACSMQRRSSTVRSMRLNVGASTGSAWRLGEFWSPASWWVGDQDSLVMVWSRGCGAAPR